MNKDHYLKLVGMFKIFKHLYYNHLERFIGFNLAGWGREESSVFNIVDKNQSSLFASIMHYTNLKTNLVNS